MKVIIGNDVEKYFQSVSVFDRYTENVKPTVYFLGLSGEVGELCGELTNSNYPFIEDTQKIENEIGDVFWYWFALANRLKIDYKHIWNNSSLKNDGNYTKEILDIVSNTGRLIEHLKKSIRDDNSKITENRLKNIEEYMIKTLDSLFTFCNSICLKPSSILQSNYDKLSARQIVGTLQGEGDGKERIGASL